MIAPIRSAGLILSYKCNSRCRHCLYACGPEWRDWIDIEDGRKILQGMADTVGRESRVHFAGGEAFLDFPRLLKLVEIAVELGISIDYVETNAGWCVDEASSREKLLALRDAGLTCLLVSASPFHAEYIPPERTLRAIKLASEVFGLRGVIVWLPEFLRQITGIRTNGIIGFEEFVEKCGFDAASQAAAYGGAMIPGGRAGIRLGEYLQRRPAQTFLGETCSHELLYSAHGHFDLYGSYIPASCTGIVHRDARALPSMIKNFDLREYAIIRTLCEDGLDGLLELASDRFGFEVSPDGYVGKCHLCVDIRRHIALKTDEYPELAPRGFYEGL